MKRTPFTTTIDSALLKKVKIAAIRKGRSVNDIIEQCFREYLKRPTGQK